MMNKFNPSRETHTEYLQRMAKQVGHWAFAKYMLKQGYSFRCTYYLIFGCYPKEIKR